MGRRGLPGLGGLQGRVGGLSALVGEGGIAAGPVSRHDQQFLCPHLHLRARPLIPLNPRMDEESLSAE